MKKKIIGVLGGMGPESTAIFYHELILQCQKQYGAKYDEDYPEIFIYNLPIPDIVEGLDAPERTRDVLIGGAKKLESIGVDFIVMPCNTAHYFHGDMQNAISIPFLSITNETAKKVRSENFTKVGLLATQTTIQHQLYNKDLDKFGVTLVVPEEQENVTKIIMNILAGVKLDSDRVELKEIIEVLRSRGAQAIILGCTDIPILLQQKDTDVLLFDTVEILAEATIRFALQSSHSSS